LFDNSEIELVLSGLFIDGLEKYVLATGIFSELTEKEGGTDTI
jgi:hypothetical protein